MDLHYPDEFVAALQAVWGDGFLSPGGPAEVAAMMADTRLDGGAVLDIGCGVGGIDVLLVRDYGAGAVTAIDVEPQLITHSQARFAREGLDGRITAQLVEPGPLPFAPASFDAVFSKDAMLHIPDKPALYADILRVLKPGGRLIASDWLRGGEAGTPIPEELAEWGRITGLEAVFATPTQTQTALQGSGFDDARVIDRNAWYREEIKNEERQVNGPGLETLKAALGPEMAELRVRSYAIRRKAVDVGALRPCHLYGVKPLSG